MTAREMARDRRQHEARTIEAGQVAFRLLGPVRVLRGEAELEVGPPQHKVILALLLAQAGRYVSVDELVEAVWGQAPPSTAVNLVHRAIGALRRLLQPELPVRVSGRYLLRAGTGYRLAVDAHTLDLLQFRLLVVQARQASDPAAAGGLYLRALGLRRGPCGQDLSLASGRPLAFAAIDREYLTAVRDAADSALAAGLADQVLPVLRDAAASDRLDEPLQARLMLALEASGHRAEAFWVYHEARDRLATGLGVDPGPELQATYHKLLHSEPAEAYPPARSAPVVAPAQLPADLPLFAGRMREVARVCSTLAGAADTDSMVISVIDGMAGVGKTTLAVHCGHKTAAHFPDGQLYVNLRGFDPHGSTLEPGAALRGFLEALGIPADRVPATVPGQAALYRSLLAGRRVLVLLDNARDVEQVRPLLPAASGCAVIITSRNRLTGLVVSQGAEPTTLDVLSADEAREAMERRLGPDRVGAELDAIEEIAQSCGRLPLALAVVAGRAVAQQAFSLASIASELRSWQGSLDAFAGPDPQTDVRSVFSWSYELLSPAAARMFRLLSAHGGPDISLPALASLAGLSRRVSRGLVSELVEARLVAERQPGRYLMHDLIRAYARDLSTEADTANDRDRALRRAMDHYLHTAYAASAVLPPYRRMTSPGAPEPGVIPEAPSGRVEAYAWYAAEYQVLLTTIRQAAGAGFSHDAGRLALAMQEYFQCAGRMHDWESIMRTVGAEPIGARASAALDPALQALALNAALFSTETEAVRARLDQVYWSPTASIPAA